MTTFVLVLGAWSGAHGFRHVRKLLQSHGHDVFTPSLTGLGERVHPSHPLVNLTIHIRDLVNHVLHEDLQHMVLLGVSYWKAARHAQHSAAWRYLGIETNQMVASNRPQELAHLLMQET